MSDMVLFLTSYHIWKSAHPAQALQIGTSHCLSKPQYVMRLVLQIMLLCIVVYTSTRCLSHPVMHYLHHFQPLVVHNSNLSFIYAN